MKHAPSLTPTDAYASPSMLKLGRGLIRRCPDCGSGGLFRRYFTMVDDCPRCDLHFERDEGYWVGAMIVNTAFAILVFLAIVVGGAALTWPDVPWNTLLFSSIAAMVIVPVALYPISKTVWIAMDLLARPRPDRPEPADLP